MEAVSAKIGGTHTLAASRPRRDMDALRKIRTMRANGLLLKQIGYEMGGWSVARVSHYLKKGHYWRKS